MVPPSPRSATAAASNEEHAKLLHRMPGNSVLLKNNNL
jgi:hypothetical protein